MSLCGKYAIKDTCATIRYEILSETSVSSDDDLLDDSGIL
jgi:hypothetical protein